MTVRFSLKRGEISSIDVVADLISTTEGQYDNCEITITIFEGDIHGVNVRPSTPKVKT